MKNKIFISIILLVTIFLGACTEEKEVVLKDLVFLEKTTDYYQTSYVFESAIDKKYYLVEVSNWEYDNSSYKKGDVVQLDARNYDADAITALVVYSLSDGVQTPEQEVFINDDWASLFILTDYTKD